MLKLSHCIMKVVLSQEIPSKEIKNFHFFLKMFKTLLSANSLEMVDLLLHEYEHLDLINWKNNAGKTHVCKIWLKHHYC